MGTPSTTLNTQSTALRAGKLPNAPTKAEQSIQQNQQVAQQLSPQQLAELAAEAERRRRGGGGGGASRKIEAYVPFSFLKMARASDLLKQFFISQFQANAGEARGIEARPVAAQPAPEGAVAKFAGALKGAFVNIASFPMNAAKMAFQLGANVMNLGVVAAAGLANKIFKALLGKDEDKVENNDDLDEGDKFDFMESFKSLFVKQQREGHSENRRNIFSHIENMADQVVKALTRN